MRIGFPLVDRAPYIESDLRILSRSHDVRLLECKSLRELVTSLTRVRLVDCLYCWFGSLRFLPLVVTAKLLGKTVVVVVAGYDVASRMDLHYGNLRPGLGRFFGRILFRLVDRVLAVSEYCRAEAIRNAKVSAAKVVTIPLGFDPDYYRCGDKTEDPPIVVCVSPVNEHGIRVKGIGNFCAVAAKVPEARFVSVGTVNDATRTRLEHRFGHVVEFLGRKSHDELKEIYKRAAVYLQLSASEGFCAAAAEAMLCGCKAVVTRAGGLPEVVGEAGWLVPVGDVERAASAVKEALQTPPINERAGRLRVSGKFSEVSRAARIQSVLTELTRLGPAEIEPSHRVPL